MKIILNTWHITINLFYGFVGILHFSFYRGEAKCLANNSTLQQEDSLMPKSKKTLIWYFEIVGCKIHIKQEIKKSNLWQNSLQNMWVYSHCCLFIYIQLQIYDHVQVVTNLKRGLHSDKVVSQNGSMSVLYQIFGRFRALALQPIVFW